MTKYPFEVTRDELQQDLEPYVDVIFASLESEFLVMPKGEGFVEYPIFEQGNEIIASDMLKLPLDK